VRFDRDGATKADSAETITFNRFSPDPIFGVRKRYQSKYSANSPTSSDLGRWCDLHLHGNNISSSDGRTITYTVFDQTKRIQKGVEYTEFSYGIGNERIKRVDSNTIDGSRTTTYFGNVERIVQDGGNAFYRRSIGGIALADYFPSTQVQSTVYLLKDHLCSIEKVVTTSGVTAMTFGAFGERRAFTWQGTLSASLTSSTNIGISTRGFTGHEHADGLGIIHMNGCIYDPKLGRMLQADPFVQNPKDSQSLNRYIYVLNNPLSYTDPSGYLSFSRFVKKWGRMIVASVATYFTAGLASTWAIGWGFAAGTVGNAAIAGAVAGFVGGGILTGTLKGAFYGGLTGAALGGIGATGWNNVAKPLTSGTASGITTDLQGGKFGHGFLSAGMGFWSGLKFGGPRDFGKFLASSIAGGTISEITGGKFANGAVSAGLAYVVAASAHELKQSRLETAPNSEKRPELEGIANDPAIRKEIDAAWAASNPYAVDPALKQENGFWILRDNKSQALSVYPFSSNGATNDTMIPGPVPQEPGKAPAAFFHTHPNTSAEGYISTPSSSDINFANQTVKLPGIIRTHDGMYYFGPK